MNVLLGILVAILINVVTAGGTGVASIAGLGAAAIGWAGWEAWRSASSRAG